MEKLKLVPLHSQDVTELANKQSVVVKLNSQEFGAKTQELLEWGYSFIKIRFDNDFLVLFRGRVQKQ